ncbi:hypothetical protein [Nautilia sp.]
MRYLILLIASFLFAATNLIIQYPGLKKEYYKNQIVTLNIKVITPKEINLTFIPPLNSELNVTKTNSLIYNLKLKYQNDDKTKKLFILGKNIYKEIDLSRLYSTVKLNKINDFCGVLADSLKIDNVIASKYDNRYNMLSFNIQSSNGNLKDFTLKIKDENLTLSNSNKASFFTLVPKNTHTISFYYFNTSMDNYKKINIPINIKEETISTQTDLNPEENTVFTPVNILLLSVTALLIVIFLIYQKIWLLIPPLLLSAFLIYLNLPKGTGYLSRNTKVYILPTKNSTVFYEAPVGVKVKILKKLKHYTKIKIKNKIGWVKNEDIK